MAKNGLSDLAIRKMPAPKRGRTEIRDTKVPQLILRVTPSGKKTFSARYRTTSGQRRFKIGDYPALSLTDARKEVLKILAEVHCGIDPQVRKQAERQAHLTLTIESACLQFIDEYSRPRNRSWKKTESALRNHLVPSLGKKQVKEVTRQELIILLDRLAAEMPYAANTLQRQLSRLFGWLLEKDYVDQNPMLGIKPPAREASRDRVLTDLELLAIWEAAEKLGYPFGPFFQILLLTGQRRTETSKMRWELIDEQQQNWTIPRELTKNDRAQEVPLSDLAMGILKRIPKQTSGFVFTTNNKTSISGFSHAKDQLDELIDNHIEDWRPHDLRRSVSTGLARLRNDYLVRASVLNHSNRRLEGVGSVYNRYDYYEEKRVALQNWSHHVEILISKKDSNNVIELAG